MYFKVLFHCTKICCTYFPLTSHINMTFLIQSHTNLKFKLLISFVEKVDLILDWVNFLYINYSSCIATFADLFTLFYPFTPSVALQRAGQSREVHSQPHFVFYFFILFQYGAACEDILAPEPIPCHHIINDEILRRLHSIIISEELKSQISQGLSHSSHRYDFPACSVFHQ